MTDTTVAKDFLAIATWGLHELTATFVAPTVPTITAVELTTTSIRVTVDGDAGVTNTVYYDLSDGTAWTTGNDRSGDGTINITGLIAGNTYVIVVQSDNTNSLSVMSNKVQLTLSTGTAVEPTGDAAIHLNAFAEADPGTYKPGTGGERLIKYIPDYQEPEEGEGLTGLKPKIFIEVANSSTFGISSSEVDMGTDKFALAVNIGESSQDRRITRIVKQDNEMVLYEIN